MQEIEIIMSKSVLMKKRYLVGERVMELGCPAKNRLVRLVE